MQYAEEFGKYDHTNQSHQTLLQKGTNYITEFYDRVLDCSSQNAHCITTWSATETHCRRYSKERGLDVAYAMRLPPM